MRVSLSLLCLIAACASAPRDRSFVPEPSRRETTSNQIDGVELRRASGTTAEDGLRQFRPEFLRASPAMGERGLRMIPASVYVDGTFTGTPDVLRTIPLSSVIEIRRLSASAARDWFGAACPCAGGVLLVVTRR